jgi:hypothetical protein
MLNQGIIPEEDPDSIDYTDSGFPNNGNILRGRSDPLGLNPANYANIEDEVQNDLLMVQQQRNYKLANSNN